MARVSSYIRRSKTGKITRVRAHGRVSPQRAVRVRREFDAYVKGKRQRQAKLMRHAQRRRKVALLGVVNRGRSRFPKKTLKHLRREEFKKWYGPTGATYP